MYYNIKEKEIEEGENYMVTEKAGCFLIKKETREIALIYRQKQEDYSFPKGHMEKGETLKETDRKSVV